MNVSRPWLAFVVALCCLPLFVNLGRADLQDDEAIYSFGVDRLLESGDWLAPKSSPHEDAVFLEKPPLKFWIVAAPIRAGFLPHNEFGMRFWDALFGGIAFLYVFAIGSRLAGPMCGAVAVLILFEHRPLLFDHGLRTNNMEAALFLCYCGGAFHFLEWARLTPDGAPVRPRRPRPAFLHAVAAGLYFVLGFMTKFLAAIFLPLIVVAATLLLPAPRAKLFRGWKDWVAVSALVVALCAPWFVYAHWRFGAKLWETIFSEHVYRRFHAYLDPEHVQPWNFYWSNIWARLGDSDAQALVAAGVGALVVQTARRRCLDGLLVLVWFALPVALISAGTSKIYHYSYPFLPPLALAGGYVPGLVFMLGAAPLARLGRAATDRIAYAWPRAGAALRRPAMRRLLLAGATTAFLVASASLVFGPLRVRAGSTDLFKSSGMLRPALIVLILGMLARAPRAMTTTALALLLIAVLPTDAYRRTWARLNADISPQRDAAECIRRVAAANRTEGRGLYYDVSDKAFGHPLNYYFRRVQPWTRAASPGADLMRYLHDPVEQRPIVISGDIYQTFRYQHPGSLRETIPMVKLGGDVLLLLPGPYAPCSTEAMGSSEAAPSRAFR
jgi:4-amino-4-deoxy-L-arabinose transferase-like glycosyltransferase